MENGFEFYEKNGGVCVTGIPVPGAVCVIPETLGGFPVTELSDKLFRNAETEEVFLPKTLRKVGRYLFYGCEKLRALHVYGTTLEIGGGIFTGCKSMRELFIHVDRDGASALRDFVTELSERITVHLFVPTEGGEREAARLIFPLYYDEAVENTPARLIGFAIHGSGQKYRYCLEGKGIRYEKYDKVFPYEQIEEPELLAAEVALCRLRYPMELREEAKEQYERFLRDHLFAVLLGKIRDGETVQWLLGRFPETLSRGELEGLAAEAAKQKLPELSARLMDLNRRRFGGKKKKSFDL